MTRPSWPVEPVTSATRLRKSSCSIPSLRGEVMMGFVSREPPRKILPRSRGKPVSGFVEAAILGRRDPHGNELPGAFRLRKQPVAAGFSDENFGLGGVALDLLPQAVDMGLERVRGHPGIVAPDLAEQGRPVDRPIAGVIKIAKDRGFLLGQAHLFAPEI